MLKDLLIRPIREPLIGPGAVVYKLGFELNHVDIEGVKVLRENEVHQNLKMQAAASPLTTKH